MGSKREWADDLGAVPVTIYLRCRNREVIVMDNFETRVIDKLDCLSEVTTETKTKVVELEKQNEKVFTLIRSTEAQTNINMANINNLKQHRNGKGWLGKLLVRLFVGSI